MITKPTWLLCTIIGLRAILSIFLWNHSGKFFWSDLPPEIGPVVV